MNSRHLHLLSLLVTFFYLPHATTGTPSTSITSPGYSDVPPNIFLTGPQLTPDIRARIAHVKALHPRYNVSFYDNARSETFLRDHYTPLHVSTFRTLRHGAHKADFLRYCLLLRFGGFYLDTDNVPTAPLPTCTPSYAKQPATFPPAYSVDMVSVLAQAPRLCRKVNGKHCSARTFAHPICLPCRHIHNGFIVARAGSALMRQLIQFMIRHPQPTRGSHDHRHPKLMYHFYVRNFYITVAKSLQEPHLKPGVVYMLPGGETILLVDAVGFGQRVLSPSSRNTSSSSSSSSTSEESQPQAQWGIFRCMKLGVKEGGPNGEATQGPHTFLPAARR